MNTKRIFTNTQLLTTGAAALFLCLAGVAHAAVYSLSPGDDIQAAIDIASNGDTIELAAGTYTVTSELQILDKGITLKGTSGALNTIIQRDTGSAVEHRILYIDGSSSKPGGVYNSAVGTTVQGLTFRNGVAPQGGNIYVNESPYTVIKNSIIENGTAQVGGGIDMSAGGSLVNSIVRNNQTTGGSPQFGGGVYARYGGNTIKNSIIYGNNSSIGGGLGIQDGGILNDPALGGADSRIRVLNSTIANNTASGFNAGPYGVFYGGGVGSQLAGKPAFIIDSIVWNNAINNILNITPGGGTLNVQYTDTTDTSMNYVGSNNISSDPLFNGTGAQPWEFYQLAGGSQALTGSTVNGVMGAVLSESDFLGSPTTPAVPEPATASLIGVGALMLTFRRRRRCA